MSFRLIVTTFWKCTSWGGGEISRCVEKCKLAFGPASKLMTGLLFILGGTTKPDRP